MSDKSTQIQVKITWLNTNPVKLWFNGKLVWANDKEVASDAAITDYDTVLVLDVVEAIRFSVIFINGLAANSLMNQIARTNVEIELLNSVRTVLNSVTIEEEKEEEIDETWDNE